MGCSFRFAGNPGRTKEECRIESLAGQHAPRAAKANEKPAGLSLKAKGKMIDDKKSTDPGLSAAERKTLRNREAREAIADHEEAQRALHGNLERLRPWSSSIPAPPVMDQGRIGRGPSACLSRTGD